MEDEEIPLGFLPGFSLRRGAERRHFPGRVQKIWTL